MVTKKTYSALLIGTLLLLTSSLALAQHPMGLMGVLKNRLDLTPQQMMAIKELQKKHHEDVFPLTQELRAKQQALRAALESTQPNTTAVGQIVVEQQALRKQLQGLNEKLRSGILALLTPEQKQKVALFGLFRFGEMSRRPRMEMGHGMGSR
jgi:Spy/CpxP family protein refolding chaperone